MKTNFSGSGKHFAVLKSLIPILPMISLLLLCGCGQNELYQTDILVQGFQVKFNIDPGDVNASDFKRLNNEAMAIVKNRLNQFFAQDSSVSMLNASRGPVEVSGDIYTDLLTIENLSKSMGNGWNPYLGEVENIWRNQGSEPVMMEVEAGVDKCRRTSLTLVDGSKVVLNGDGNLNPRRFVLGSALDAASVVLIKGGIKAAILQIEDVYLFWGQKNRDDKWSFNLVLPDRDSVSYNVQPQDGAVCIVRSENNTMDSPLLVVNPQTGKPVANGNAVLIWSSSAATAAVCAEAAVWMEKSQAFNFISAQQSVYILFMYRDMLGYLVETDQEMSRWVEMDLREQE